MDKDLWLLEEVKRLLNDKNNLCKNVSSVNKIKINQDEIDRRADEIGVYLFKQINQGSKTLVLKKNNK